MIPDKVIVLGYEFKVIRDSTDSKWRYEWGYIDVELLTIYINANASELTQRRTLWHEIIHAIEFAVGVDLVENEDYSIANLLALGITEVLDNNPGLY